MPHHGDGDKGIAASVYVVVEMRMKKREKSLVVEVMFMRGRRYQSKPLIQDSHQKRIHEQSKGLEKRERESEKKSISKKDKRIYLWKSWKR